MFFAITDNFRADLTAALQNTHNSSLVLRPALGNHALAPICVHEASRTTNESFVHFNVFTFTAHLVHAAALQCQAQTVENKPCRLLSDSQVAPHFIRANSILAVDEHPKSGKPFVERDSGVLENRSNLDAELVVTLFALPAALRSEIVVLFVSALWTHWAIRPT